MWVVLVDHIRLSEFYFLCFLFYWSGVVVLMTGIRFLRVMMSCLLLLSCRGSSISCLQLDCWRWVFQSCWSPFHFTLFILLGCPNWCPNWPYLTYVYYVLLLNTHIDGFWSNGKGCFVAHIWCLPQSMMLVCRRLPFCDNFFFFLLTIVHFLWQVKSVSIMSGTIT